MLQHTDHFIGLFSRIFDENCFIMQDFYAACRPPPTELIRNSFNFICCSGTSLVPSATSIQEMFTCRWISLSSTTWRSRNNPWKNFALDLWSKLQCPYVSRITLQAARETCFGWTISELVVFASARYVTVRPAGYWSNDTETILLRRRPKQTTASGEKSLTSSAERRTASISSDNMSTTTSRARSRNTLLPSIKPAHRVSRNRLRNEWPISGQMYWHSAKCPIGECQNILTTHRICC